MEKVLLICNSYPYSGEPFLRTEIDFLPENISLDVWPFFIDRAKVDGSTVPEGITTHIYEAPSIRGRIKCLLKGIGTFLSEGEFKAAVIKKHGIRNVIKAIKFAYISEIRLQSIEKWLKEKPGEDYTVYTYWMYETAYIGARLKAQMPGSKFVTRCHGYDLYEERHPNGYLPFRDFILNHADSLFPISDNGRSYLGRLYGKEIEDKSRVARLGTIRKAEMPELQEKEEGIVLVSCSNLVDVKRVHLIIHALLNCEKQVTWYHFGDGELRGNLEKQAEALPDNVQHKFMGYCANDDVQRFYAEHYIDAFVNVSQSEGIPVSVMEAESYGIPVIATDVGGTSEIVHNGENGVLLKADFTDEELLSAIDEVVEKVDQYRACALHTWESMSDANKVFPEFYMKLAEV